MHRWKAVHLRPFWAFKGSNNRAVFHYVGSENTRSLAGISTHLLLHDGCPYLGAREERCHCGTQPPFIRRVPVENLLYAYVLPSACRLGATGSKSTITRHKPSSAFMITYSHQTLFFPWCHVTLLPAAPVSVMKTLCSSCFGKHRSISVSP